MPPNEMAQLLLRKPAQDEFTIRKLVDDPESPDEIIGFHAQQAVEKYFKAVLATKSIPYRETHNLAELIDVMRDHGILLPPEMEDVRALTPFAAELRYDEFLPDSDSAFDRISALRHVDRTHKKDQIGETTPRLARLYAQTTEKTLSRDLNEVIGMGLIVKEANGYRACKEVILGFLPFRAPNTDLTHPSDDR